MIDANDRRKYFFLSKIALKYRLSLNNMCRLLHIDVNENNKINLYNNLLIANPDEEDGLRFLLCSEYINEYDKKNGEYSIQEKTEKGLEEKLESNIKRAKISRKLEEYNNLQKIILNDIPKRIDLAKNNKDASLLNSLKEKLDSLKKQYDLMTNDLIVADEDIEFEDFYNVYKKIKENAKKEGKNIHLTHKEGLIISRYRYIHGISQVKMCEKLDIVVETLKRLEENNKELDPILYFKIKKLDSHLCDFYFSTRKK